MIGGVFANFRQSPCSGFANVLEAKSKTVPGVCVLWVNGGVASIDFSSLVKPLQRKVGTGQSQQGISIRGVVLEHFLKRRNGLFSLSQLYEVNA